MERLDILEDLALQQLKRAHRALARPKGVAQA